MINSHLVGTTPDGDNIYLEYSWSSAENYQYIITNIKKCAIRDDDESFYLVKDSDIELYAFKEILNDKLIFTNIDTGVEITIDPRIKETRDTIRIYTSDESKEDSTKVFCIKRAWYYIEKIPFDTNFFKVGHAYRINNSKGCKITDDGFVHALLREITCEHMNFVYISDLSFGVTDTITVSPREYRRRCDHKRRYYAMDPNDKWTDEIKELNKNE